MLSCSFGFLSLCYSGVTEVSQDCLISETLGRNSSPRVCVCVALMLFAAQECVPDAFLFLWLQWKTCGIQLLGLCGGKWGSCWRPARPQGGKTLSGMALDFSLPGHIVLGTTTELSFHFYTVWATFPLCCFSTPRTSVRFTALWVELTTQQRVSAAVTLTWKYTNFCSKAPDILLLCVHSWQESSVIKIRLRNYLTTVKTHL